MNKLSREYAEELAEKQYPLSGITGSDAIIKCVREGVIKGFMACAEHARVKIKSIEEDRQLGYDRRDDHIQVLKDEIKQLKSNIALGNNELENLSIEFNTLELKIKQLREENERLTREQARKIFMSGAMWEQGATDENFNDVWEALNQQEK